MKVLLLLFLLLNADDDDRINRIAKINEIKKEAEKAYLSKDYETAVLKYKILTDSFSVDDDRVLLNLSNAYFHLKDTSQALTHYQQLTASKDNHIKSVAFQQMGILANQVNKNKEALSLFKEALKANPFNEEARYNYELLKKKLKQQDQQKKDQQDQQNDDQQNQQKQNQQGKKNKQNQDKQQDQEGKKEPQDKKQGEQGEEQKKEKQNQEGEQKKQEQDQSSQGEEEEPEEQQSQAGEKQEQKEADAMSQPTVAERLKEMNMTEEKARMILEAMKNNEIQYIQQNTRKAKTSPDPGKPDW